MRQLAGTDISDYPEKVSGFLIAGEQPVLMKGEINLVVIIENPPPYTCCAGEFAFKCVNDFGLIFLSPAIALLISVIIIAKAAIIFFILIFDFPVINFNSLLSQSLIKANRCLLIYGSKKKKIPRSFSWD